MSLSRSNTPGLVWTVDESRLKVVQLLRGGWKVHTEHFDQQQNRYLERYGLQRIFKTRARAVDAARMALSQEPIPLKTVSWKPTARAGIYRSSDGHWELRREPIPSSSSSGCPSKQVSVVRPFSLAASEAVKRCPGSFDVLLGQKYQTRTMRVLAIRVEIFNQSSGIASA